jgi:hypothetical protein
MMLAFSPLALLGFASLASAPGTDALVFGVVKGMKLTKHFEASLELKTKSTSYTVAGQDAPKELTDKMRMSTSIRHVFELEDEYVDVEGSQPKEIWRRFRAAKQSSTHRGATEGDPRSDARERESSLVGFTVAFTWIEKDRKYDTAYHGEQGVAILLYGLTEDTDCLRFLPKRTVAPDDTWTIEPSALNDLVMPSGERFDAQGGGQTELSFFKQAVGTVEAKYGGARNVDGRKCGVVALTAKLSMKSGSKDVTVAVELGGELLWDLDGKHLHSYDLRGPFEMKVSSHDTIEHEGKRYPEDRAVVLAGEVKLSGRM